MKPSMRAQSVMYSLGAHVTAQGPYSNIKQTERSHGINQTLCKSPPQQVQFGRFPCPILAPPRPTTRPFPVSVTLQLSVAESGGGGIPRNATDSWQWHVQHAAHLRPHFGRAQHADARSAQESDACMGWEWTFLPPKIWQSDGRNAAPLIRVADSSPIHQQ